MLIAGTQDKARVLLKLSYPALICFPGVGLKKEMDNKTTGWQPPTPWLMLNLVIGKSCVNQKWC